MFPRSEIDSITSLLTSIQPPRSWSLDGYISKKCFIACDMPKTLFGKIGSHICSIWLPLFPTFPTLSIVVATAADSYLLGYKCMQTNILTLVTTTKRNKARKNLFACFIFSSFLQVSDCWEEYWNSVKSDIGMMTS